MLTNLRALLENETYPHSYVHKFIGPHTPTFILEVEKLRNQFLHLDLVVESRQSKKGGYISYTFTFLANSAEEILVVIQATSALQELKMIL